MTSADDLLTLVRDFHHEEQSFDVDAILRAGKRKRRQRVLVGAVGLATLAVVSIAVIGVATSGGAGTARLVQPATRALPGHGLLASNQPRGSIETLSVTDSGWTAVVYLDTAGALCEGWIDPATAVLGGECGAVPPPGAKPHPRSSTDFTPALLTEPKTGVTGKTVEAFGLVGVNTKTLTITGANGPLVVITSKISDAYGQRVWLATFPATHDAKPALVNIRAYNARGSVIASLRFGTPTEGATPSNLPYMSTPSADPSAG